MAVFDIASRTIKLKIVYYGCALGGKTTNLVTLHRITDPDSNQGMVSIATNDDRTLSFDLLPMSLGQIGGLTVKVKTYTVPGQVQYEITRRQVLGGADGVVQIVDSTPGARNVWALENLRLNLRANGVDPDEIPTILQWNKRDLPNAAKLSELEATLNKHGLPAFEAVATTGAGVITTFARILKLTLGHTYAKHGRKSVSADMISHTVDAALSDALVRENDLVTGPIRESPRDLLPHSDLAPGIAKPKNEPQELLLSETVRANMMLAEKLEGMHATEDLGQRRGMMMAAISELAPKLADREGVNLPSGVMASLLRGSRRKQGSILLFKSGQSALIEQEVVPTGADPLNEPIGGDVGTVAFRLVRDQQFRVLQDLGDDLFFGDIPTSCHSLRSLLIAPLTCDGMTFGAIFVYGQASEGWFDEAEREYWKTAATLAGLSLHWRALRHKILEGKTS